MDLSLLNPLLIGMVADERHNGVTGIVMVSLLVPALIKLGAVTPAAHMFAFYFAILSAITPKSRT